MTIPGQQRFTAQSTSAPIRVLVVDDHPAVRRGVRALIDSEPDMRVVAEARRGEEARATLPVVQAWRARLDPQDHAIFGMLVDGIDPAAIAERLGITGQELHRRRVVMLRALMPRRAPTAGPPVRAPLDYDRGHRRRDRHVP